MTKPYEKPTNFDETRDFDSDSDKALKNAGFGEWTKPIRVKKPK